MADDPSDVASRKVKQLVVLVDKMEQAQSALELKLRATEEKLRTEQATTARLTEELASVNTTLEEERQIRDVQRKELVKTRETLTEKAEVVNTLLRDADEQLKMQKMAVKFAEDIRAHYHISD